jgi:repressor LexA
MHTCSVNRCAVAIRIGGFLRLSRPPRLEQVAMKGLTERQEEVLRYIAERLQETGYPPTIREIGNGLGIRSTNGVNDHLKALERKGYLDRSSSKSRAIQLTDLASEVDGMDAYAPSTPPSMGISVPLLGEIAAGAPLESVSTDCERVVLDPAWIGRKDEADIFALRVQGESMIGDGIFDGDLIFVERQSQVRRGAMVAVWMNGGATVKRYYQDGDVIRLEPSNPTMEPILVHASSGEEVRLLGRVVGVYRQVST